MRITTKGTKHTKEKQWFVSLQNLSALYVLCGELRTPYKMTKNRGGDPKISTFKVHPPLFSEFTIFLMDNDQGDHSDWREGFPILTKMAKV